MIAPLKGMEYYNITLKALKVIYIGQRDSGKMFFNENCSTFMLKPLSVSQEISREK